MREYANKVGYVATFLTALSLGGCENDASQLEKSANRAAGAYAGKKVTLDAVLPARYQPMIGKTVREVEGIARGFSGNVRRRSEPVVDMVNMELSGSDISQLLGTPAPTSAYLEFTEGDSRTSGFVFMLTFNEVDTGKAFESAVQSLYARFGKPKFRPRGQDTAVWEEKGFLHAAQIRRLEGERKNHIAYSLSLQRPE